MKMFKYIVKMCPSYLVVSTKLILYNIIQIITQIEKRVHKPQFNGVTCPNKDCEFYDLTGQGNVVGNGTSINRGEKTETFYYFRGF